MIERLIPSLNMETESEIIIIGAGAAGLMAGVMLSKSFRVIILEGRDRCGGRINTHYDVFPDAIEAGAEFIHGEQKLTHELASRYGLSCQAVEGRFYEFRSGRVSEDDQSDPQWSKLFRVLDTLDEDIDMQHFLDKHFSGGEFSGLRQRGKAFAEGYDAADLTRVSAFALRNEWQNQDDENQSRLHSGYGELIRRMEAEFRDNGGTVFFESVVHKAGWKPNHVIIETATGNTFISKILITTVPLGVLQREHITFDPELSEHKAGFKKLGFGGVIKFFYRFTPVLQERLMKRFPKFSFIFSDARVPTWWSQNPSEIPVITGWLAGPSACEVAGNVSVLQQMALDSLAYLLDCSVDEVSQNITANHIADWISDPFTCGAYAYATVGSADTIQFLSRPLSDTLYFAGEALYHGPAMGTVEAALQSGSQVAQRILSAAGIS